MKNTMNATIQKWLPGASGTSSASKPSRFRDEMNAQSCFAAAIARTRTTPGLRRDLVNLHCQIRPPKEVSQSLWATLVGPG